MAGLRKAKKYDWKDSNLALFGSPLEREVKKAAAQTEPAWEGSGQKVGIQIWRIVKFKVTHWPKDDYGSFYDGDSYIILNTYKTPDTDSEQLLYDVHFWIGKNSTADEYGTAAYKTVELDTYHNDGPVQHREVQGHESQLFKSYFKTITTMSGGADTGFKRVTPEQYQPRLLHFSGTRRTVEVKEVPLFKNKLNSNDVFILDLGLTIYQWNGSGANKDERFKALQFLQTLKSERSGKPKVETLDEDSVGPSAAQYCQQIESDRSGRVTTIVLDENQCSEAHAFYEHLSGEAGDDDDDVPDKAGDKVLMRVSDASGQLKCEEVKRLGPEEGSFSKSDLDKKDVFLIDTGDQLLTWVGSEASVDERRKCMQYAHNYLMTTDHPFVPVTCIKDGQTNKEFEAAVQ